MGSGTSRSSLTRDECKQHVPEDKWDESWDEFYFADGKSVSSEIAERVWCKAERWAAHIAASAVVEPKNDESPPEDAQPGASDEAADAADADDLVATYPRLRGGEPLPGVQALDFSAIIADKRGQHLAGTREWVFDAVEKWRVDTDAAKLFWLVGGGGTGKSVAAAEMLARLLDKQNAAAWHFFSVSTPSRRGRRLRHCCGRWRACFVRPSRASKTRCAREAVTTRRTRSTSSSRLY